MADKTFEEKAAEAAKAAKEVPAAAPSMNQLIADAVGRAMLEALPQAVAVVQRMNNPEQSAEAKAATQEAMQRQVDSRETCQECGQRISACKRNHRRMAVFPSDYGEWFQGVIINGRRYLSNNAQHFITVPADANIEHMISEWEVGERNLRTSRQATHNSGSIGNGGGGFVPAVSAGWR